MIGGEELAMTMRLGFSLDRMVMIDSRSVVPRFICLSTATNHCSVARKMVGVLLRQSCG